MRREIWINHISLRRLAALVFGLPPDAGIWRQDFLPPVEERLAQIFERQDAWFRALLEAQMGQAKVSVPGELHVVRPSDRDVEPEVRRVETDPDAIAAWFAANG